MKTHFLNRYNKFIAACKLAPVHDSYTELHHIIPKSMGGSDDAENLIRLSARQHFIAHWMLWKAYETHSLAFAFSMMQIPNKNHNRTRKISSTVYEALKKFKSKEQSKTNKDRWKDPEWAAKQKLIFSKAASTPAERKRRSENASKFNKIYKKQRSETHLKLWQNPEWAANAKQKMSENSPKKKAVIVEGVRYESVKEVAEKYGMLKTSIRYRILSPHFADWKYE